MKINRFSLKKLRQFLINISAAVIRVSLVLVATEFILDKTMQATIEASAVALNSGSTLGTVIGNVLPVITICLETLFLIGAILLIVSDKSWSNFWKGHTYPSDTQ